MKAFDIFASREKGAGLESNSRTGAFRRISAIVLMLALCLSLAACGSAPAPAAPAEQPAAAPAVPAEQPEAPAAADSNRVVIYTPTEDYLIEYMQQRLDEAFPDYEIVQEFYHSGDLAAKLKAEGLATECDIIFDCEYGYLQSLSDILAVIDFVDASQFVEDMQSADGKYMPVDRYSGSVIVNTEVLAAKGVALPESYQDLLKPEYKGLIEMPDPTSSSTGYLFVKSLVNAMGEEEAFAYFDALDENVLQFTSGGSAPVKDAVAGECGIALSLTFKAVDMINEGAPLQILFFDEGAPYTPAGLSIVAGHEERAAVVDVVKYFYSDIIDDYLNTYLPEQIKVDQVNTVPNYPTDIPYSDMSNNTPDVKAALLAQWDH